MYKGLGEYTDEQTGEELAFVALWCSEISYKVKLSSDTCIVWFT